MRLATLGLVLLTGCAQTMYRWGGYDEALYQHYKNPQQREDFVANLATVIRDAEQAGARVPPGCYAEYGWALYEEARFDQAVTYFKKESTAWPESHVLMEKLIRNASRSQAPAPSTGAAGAVQGGAR